MKIEIKENYDYREDFVKCIVDILETNCEKIKSITIEKLVNNSKEHTLITFNQREHYVSYNMQIKSYYNQIMKIISDLRNENGNSYGIKIEIFKSGEHVYDEKEILYLHVVELINKKLQISKSDESLVGYCYKNAQGIPLQWTSFQDENI